MKIAFVKRTKTWLVFDPQLGWIDSSGQASSPPASVKETVFFKSLTEATAAGFKPTGAHATAIAKWDPPKKTVFAPPPPKTE
jgi:hypothetical protein